MADVCEDYNYLVDTLEDEHMKRTVHTIVYNNEESIPDADE